MLRLLRKIAFRSFVLISLGALLLTLAGCTGAGLTVPAGEAYLSIYNPNVSTPGTFDYTNITFDSSPLQALALNKITAGQTFQLTSTVKTGVAHTLVFDFVQQPTGASTVTTTPETVVITIPSGQTAYTYYGPTYTAP